MTDDIPSAAGGAYEACAPGRLPAQQVETVEALHRKFLAAWAGELSEQLGAPVAGFHMATDAPAADASAQPADGACTAILALDPGPGHISIRFAPTLLFRVLGMLIGADPGESPPARTSPTEIELHILRPFFESLSLALREAWAACPVRFGALELPPAEAASENSGTWLVLQSEFAFGEAREGFAVRLPALLARLAASQPAPAPRSAAVRADVLAAACRARVELEAVLSGSRLRMRDLLEIEPGHVLLLAQEARAPLECHVNGLPKFTGELIVSRDRTALLLAGPAPARGKSAPPNPSGPG